MVMGNAMQKSRQYRGIKSLFRQEDSPLLEFPIDNPQFFYII